MSSEIERIVLDNPVESRLWEAARKQGMLTMKEDAIIKSAQGQVPFEEVNTLEEVETSFEKFLRSRVRDLSATERKPIKMAYPAFTREYSSAERGDRMYAVFLHEKNSRFGIVAMLDWEGLGAETRALLEGAAIPPAEPDLPLLLELVASSAYPDGTDNIHAVVVTVA